MLILMSIMTKLVCWYWSIALRCRKVSCLLPAANNLSQGLVYSQGQSFTFCAGKVPINCFASYLSEEGCIAQERHNDGHLNTHLVFSLTAYY